KTWRHPKSDQLRSGVPLYRDLPFHRVIPNFIVQTGDPTGSGAGGPGYTIPDEIDPRLRHDRAGTLSMANRGADTGGSQFFITLRAIPYLDGRHTVFGYCRDIGVLRRIARAPAGPKNRPEEPPILESIDLRWGTFESPTDKPAPAGDSESAQTAPTDSPAPDAGALDLPAPSPSD
ncbi:MAG: peptidylprolyl isomerase, partial [Bradymonadaceae bacterium]